ncbi:MAG: hypothetical protein KF823_00230 [Xanthomonadales bacterium]|nr:hypothetical protein [Xanthomonadales bacterium]
MTLPCAPARRLRRLPVALLALVLAPAPALSRPLLADPIAPDALANGGAWRVDDYGGSTRSKVARWVAELPEGHHVVIGLDNLPGGAVSGTYRNLALARFDAQGEPVPWLAPPLLLPVDANHVVVDLGADTPGLDVRAVAVGTNRLYVLIDRLFQGTRQPHLFAFAFHGPLAYEQPLSTGHHGSGLSFVRLSGGDRLYVFTSHAPDGVRWSPHVRHFQVPAAGDPQPVDEWWVRPAACQLGQSCRIHGVTTNVHGALTGLPPRIYLVGSHAMASDPGNEDFLVMRLDANAQPDPGFGIHSTLVHGFDRPGSARADVALRAVVRPRFLAGGQVREHLYVTGRFDQSCRPGTAVLALDDTGAPLSGFGVAGALLFGGSAASASFCAGFNPSLTLVPMPLLDDNRLLLVGYRQCQGCPTVAALPSIDLARGQLAWQRDLPYPLAGSPERPTNLMGASRLAAGRYLLAGTTRFPDDAWVSPLLRGRYQYATLQVRADRLHGDGFD